MTHAPKTIIEYEILDAKEAKKRTLKGSASQMDGRVKLTILDKNKKPRLVHTQPFGSYVSNFGKILNYLFTGATNIGMKDTSGSATASNGYAIDLSSAIANENNYGIFIGDLRNATGFSTFTPAVGIGQTIQLSDHQLYRKLPHNGGTPDTDTTYDATSVTAVNDNILKISRTFTCSRSAGLKVSEVGLIAKDINYAKFLLLARDFVISKAGNYVQVLNGETIQIDYIFTITDGSSFTTNFLKILESINKASANASVQPKTTGGSTANTTFGRATTATKARITAPATGAYGIVVGGTTGGSPPTDSVPIPVVSDYKLNSKISHASLAHGIVTAISLTANSGETKFGVYRDFTNNGTSNIFVNEVGVVAKNNTTSLHYLINRSLLTSGDKPYVVVEPDKTLRIKVYYVFDIGSVIDLGVNPLSIKPQS